MEIKIDTFLSLATKITKIISQQANISFEEKAATVLQYHALTFLHSNPKAKLGDLAEFLNASLSSATQLTERMHKAGYLTRTGDEKDRRVIHLSLTEEGVRRIEQMKQNRRTQMKNLLSRIDQKDVDELIRIQEKLLNNLQHKPQL